MTLLRAAAGLFSFALAALLTTHLATAFRFATLPALRTLGHEDTFFVILHLGPLSFAGWQIVAIETLFALLTAIFVFVGVYAFTPSHNA